MLDIAQARGTLSSFFGSMKRRHQDRKQYAELIPLKNTPFTDISLRRHRVDKKTTVVYQIMNEIAKSFTLQCSVAIVSSFLPELAF